MCHNSDVRDIRRVIEEESEAVTVTIMMRDVFTALVRQGGNFAMPIFISLRDAIKILD